MAAWRHWCAVRRCFRIASITHAAHHCVTATDVVTAAAAAAAANRAKRRNDAHIVTIARAERTVDDSRYVKFCMHSICMLIHSMKRKIQFAAKVEC